MRDKSYGIQDEDGKRMCTKCDELKHTYYAYGFNGKCTKCIDDWLINDLKVDLSATNPFIKVCKK